MDEKKNNIRSEEIPDEIWEDGRENIIEEKKENVQDEKTIESLFEELDRIVKEMQDPGISLTDAFALYEKGVRDLRACNEMLDMVEKKMKVIAAGEDTE